MEEPGVFRRAPPWCAMFRYPCALTERVSAMRVSSAALVALIAGALGLLALGAGPAGYGIAAAASVNDARGKIVYEKCSFASTSFFCGSNLWVMNADGSGRRKLRLGRTGDYQDHEPVWSPDGHKIAFWREPKAIGRDYDMIFTANADGTQRTQLTRGASPSWSPDGRSLVFQGPHGLYLIGSHGGELSRLTSAGGTPDWSPDGRKVAFSYSDARGNALHVVNVDGSDERVLARGPAWNPKWSPNGDAIVYRNWRGGWVMNMRSGHRRHLDVSFYGGLFAWSPNGRQIIWSQEADWPNFDLWVMNRDGSGRHPVTRTPLAEDAADWTH